MGGQRLRGGQVCGQGPRGQRLREGEGHGRRGEEEVGQRLVARLRGGRRVLGLVQSIRREKVRGRGLRGGKVRCQGLRGQRLRGGQVCGQGPRGQRLRGGQVRSQ